ncbi:hypothetical protein [Streptacidiphilus sp. EB129]|jgi:hypothetical protein|uniref:hypothetical protein n=1 Tax=Streptacidiphilus sp. EB129 TaxID=3156262 RepID=UPI00351670CE
MRPKSATFGSGAAVAAVAALLLAGCASAGGVQTLDGSPAAPVSPAAPGMSVAPATQAAAVPSSTVTTVILRVYQGYWTAQERAMASGHTAGSGLETYATGAALSAAYAASFQLSQAGLGMAGAPHNNPSVTAIGPTPGQPSGQTARIQDCLDVSGWHQVNLRTGQRQDPARGLTRYRVQATARTVGGIWMVSEVRTEVGQSC